MKKLFIIFALLIATICYAGGGAYDTPWRVAKVDSAEIAWIGPIDIGPCIYNGPIEYAGETDSVFVMSSYNYHRLSIVLDAVNVLSANTSRGLPAITVKAFLTECELQPFTGLATLNKIGNTISKMAPYCFVDSSGSSAITDTTYNSEAISLSVASARVAKYLWLRADNTSCPAPGTTYLGYKVLCTDQAGFTPKTTRPRAAAGE